MSTNWQKYRTSGERALNQGKLEEAESMWLAAMEETEDFSEDDPRRATTLEGLAEAYFRQGKHSSAEQCCRQVLRIYERALGTDHPDVGVTANNLAMLLHAQRKYADAEPLYKQALNIRQKALGNNHPDVIRLLESYADLLMKTHREEEARHLRRTVQGMSTGKWNRSGSYQAMPTQAPPVPQAVHAQAAPAPARAPLPTPPQAAVTAHQAAVIQAGSTAPLPKVVLPPPRRQHARGHSRKQSVSTTSSTTTPGRAPMDETLESL